jgi:hypothetical protein
MYTTSTIPVNLWPIQAHIPVFMLVGHHSLFLPKSHLNILGLKSIETPVRDMLCLRPDTS